MFERAIFSVPKSLLDIILGLSFSTDLKKKYSTDSGVKKLFEILF